MTTITAQESARQSVARKRKRLSKQYIAYLVHSFVGLKLSLLLTVVLFTGTLAVFQQELDWLIYPEMRAEQQGERQDPGVLLDKLQAAYPENGLFFFRSSELYPHMNAYARFLDENGGYRHAWIDPYTAEVKDDTVLLSIGQFIGFMHATLFLPAIGNSLVNALGLMVLLSLITGLLAVPKFWRYFLQRPRTGNTRVFLADLHRLVGLWSLWIVLVIGVTGSWWFYEDPFVKFAGAPEIVEPYPRKPLLSYEDINKVAALGVPDMLSAAEITAQVRKTFPDMQINIINPPEHNSDPYEVVGSEQEWLIPEWRGTRVMVHPFTGEIIETFPATELTPMQRTDLAMTPIHYGTWAAGSNGPDLIVKTFYFIGGLAMTFLSVSGLLISYKRANRASRKLVGLSVTMKRLKRGWLVIRPWGGPMGVFKYLNILLLAGICVGITIALTLSSQGTKGSGFLYQQQALGPWNISMNAVAGLLEKDLPPIRPGAKTNLNVEIDTLALKEIKFLYVKVGKPRTKRAPGTLIHGPVGAKHVHLQLPKKIRDNSELWVTAVTWNGDYHQARWSLMPNGKETIDAR